MTKKVFLQKGSKTKREGGGSSQVKILLWAALALIVLVVVTPLVTRDKGSNDLSTKPEAQKGVVVREIPRALQLMQEDSLGRSDVPADMFRSEEGFSASSPYDDQGEAFDGETGLSSGAHESLGALQGQEKGVETPGGTASSKDSELQKRDEVPQQAALQRSAPSKPALPREEAPSEDLRPSPAKVSMTYGVQVGSFREEKNALAMKKSLEDRGYEVVVKPMNHETLGLLHVVQLKPVSDLSRASTLVEQIKVEENVSPFVVRIPAP